MEYANHAAQSDAATVSITIGKIFFPAGCIAAMNDTGSRQLTAITAFISDSRSMAGHLTIITMRHPTERIDIP
jgi:hypothetical protein